MCVCIKQNNNNISEISFEFVLEIFLLKFVTCDFLNLYPYTHIISYTIQKYIYLYLNIV